MRNDLKKKTITGGILAGMSILTFTFLYPIFFMLINSFKDKQEYRVSAFALPEALDISNYILLFKNFKILGNFKNTLIIATVSVAVTLVLSVFASYAFAKLQFAGRKAAYLAIICTMFIPAQVTMIPMYYLFSKLDMVNTLTSVIVSYVASSLPGTILLLTTNFMGISNEMIEAAKIDGAGYFHIVGNVILPMGIPAVAITVIFNFLMACNDLFTPMILLQKTEKKTVVVALAALMGNRGGDPPYQMAGLLLSTIPPLVIYLIFSKFIVKGLTVGSIK